jgi:hypothetical protein
MADQGSRLFERRRREFERDPASTEHRGHIPASAFSTSSAARRKAQGAQETNRKPIQRPCTKRNKLQIK